MSDARFGVHTGKVFYVNPKGKFCLLWLITPNGTDKPDEEVLVAHFKDCFQAETAIEAEVEVLDEQVHFGTRCRNRPPHPGNEIMFKTINGSLAHLRHVSAWCYASALHELRARLPEYRLIDTKLGDLNRSIRWYRNVLELIHEGNVVGSNLHWQTRPGRGARDYDGDTQDEIEKGWVDCPDPRRAFVPA